MKVYFDNAATTKLREEVIEVMMEAMNSSYGNPSSSHSFGRTSRALIESSRKEIAKHLNVNPQEIVFTSCGTESNNSILRSAIDFLDVKTIITSKIEHYAILNVVDFLKTKKIRVEYVNIDDDGNIDLEHLRSLAKIDDSKKIVSLMYVNNEIGNILDLAEVSQICQENSVLFHTDAVQAIGHFKIDLKQIKIDFLSASAHKFHGPKGVGFSYIRKNVLSEAFILGGQQERGLRAGTEAVHNIVGMSKALSISYNNLEKEFIHIKELKSYFVSKLKRIFPNTFFNGNSDNSIKNSYLIINVALPISSSKIDLLNFQLDLKGIACSKGSACQSGAALGSHVIKNIESKSNWPSLRFSFSSYNTFKEIDYLMETLRSFEKI
ncbi:MAG: cysteine desulfurase family protein [Flavobacteriaceae bacterium]|nr:cysteine desulfurase family protein [Flavobacteriaceae bacterium]